MHTSVALVTLLALFVYVWTLARAGGARGKFGVEAPATTGHPEFERHFRVQANTLEGIVTEMFTARTSERQGRLIDSDEKASMEKKKKEGYF